MKTGRYSLAQLLDSDFVDRIIIPEMQRDYVWTGDNVDGLLSSIEHNFLKKTALQLSISNNGETIDSASLSYLAKEYERLKFNTRIGFIYAYYDASDSRVLYLIDGQQRITTLFLLLLAIYTKGGKEYCKEFRKKYFLNKQPRIDYRVRENAHNYLVDFIDFQISYPEKDFFSESGRIYKDYYFDPTILSIRRNYNRIQERLESLQCDIAEYLDYVEHFIEFNYFDTGLSSQGERLYLYMNSRGEGLSLQEDIKPVIINRCNGSKIEAGGKWERWQNFFWRHRGDSPNSDNGFWGFLKLSVILHQAHFEFAWKKYESDKEPKIAGKRKVRESFVNKRFIYEQHRWVHEYIIESKDFDIQWLEKCFKAYYRLSNLYDLSKNQSYYPHLLLRLDNWRAVEVFDTIHYVAICGLLDLMIRQPDISDKNIYRFGMYLLNRCDDSDNSKNPDTATLRAIDLSTAMSENGLQDIRQLSNYSSVIKDNPNMDCSNMLIWKHIKSEEWENLFWSLTANATLDRFFNGNHDTLIKLSSDGSGNYTVSKVKESNDRFIVKFFNRLDTHDLIKALLAYGDISIDGGHNTWNFGVEMERWKFPVGDEWLIFFESDEKLDIVRRYINNEQVSSYGWCQAIGNGLSYMRNYRFLWRAGKKEFPNIILLNGTQAKENLSRSLPAHLLSLAIDGWCWHGDHRCAVFDFVIDGGVFKSVNPGAGTYAFDFIFNWEQECASWEIFLKKRMDKDFFEEEIKALSEEWEVVTSDSTRLKLKYIFKESMGYSAEGYLDSITEIKSWLKKNEAKIAGLLAQGV